MRRCYITKALAIITCAAANAFAPLAYADCQPSAEQVLFDAKWFIDNKGIDNNEQIKEIFTLANAGLVQCAERADVQGLSAFLFAAIADKVASKQDKTQVYKLAYQAVVNNSKAYDNTAPALEVELPDGSKKKLYTYNLASQVLKKSIAEMATLHQRNREFSIFKHSYPTTRNCPYSSKGRVDIEAKALSHWSGNDYHKQAIALHRLSGLGIICPDFKTRALSQSITSLSMAQAESKADKYSDEELSLKNALRKIKFAKRYHDHNQKFVDDGSIDLLAYTAVTREIFHIEKKINGLLKQIEAGK